jgi:hypothetical protein
MDLTVQLKEINAVPSMMMLNSCQIANALTGTGPHKYTYRHQPPADNKSVYEE